MITSIVLIILTVFLIAGLAILIFRCLKSLKAKDSKVQHEKDESGLAINAKGLYKSDDKTTIAIKVVRHLV